MKEIKDEQVDAISNFTDYQIIQFKIDLIILKQLINNRTNDLIDRIENFIVYWIHQIKDNLIYLKNEFKEFFILQYKKLQTLKLRSEEHTSELQSRGHIVCRLLLEKKKTI